MFTVALIIMLSDPLGTVSYRASYKGDYIKIKAEARDTNKQDTLEVKYRLLNLYNNEYTLELN